MLYCLSMGVSGDEWFRRNSSTLSRPLPLNQTSIGSAIASLNLPDKGRFIDVGGANGRIASAFKREFPNWDGVVVDASKEACSDGQRRFQSLDFFQVDITKPMDVQPLGHFDLVIVAGVFPMIPRSSLAFSVANLDSLVSGQAGKLLIRDFATALPSVSVSKHGLNQKIYKQNYGAIFQALGHYLMIFSEVVTVDEHKKYDEGSFFDLLRSTQVLQKNMNDDFFQPTL